MCHMHLNTERNDRNTTISMDSLHSATQPVTRHARPVNPVLALYICRSVCYISMDRGNCLQHSLLECFCLLPWIPFLPEQPLFSQETPESFLFNGNFKFYSKISPFYSEDNCLSSTWPCQCFLISSQPFDQQSQLLLSASCQGGTWALGKMYIHRWTWHS